MKYAYVNGIILDGTEDMEARKDLVILTDGDKIESVTAEPFDAERHKEYKVIDLAGKYIMPGLINMHVHLPAGGKPKKKPSDPKKLVKLITSNGMMRKIGINLCKGYAKTQLYSGVTTIRTVGGVADFDTIIRDRIADGELEGPRILASNMAVSVEGGHMAGSLAYIARSSEEAKNFVTKIASEKPDLIKLMITGGVLDAKKKGEPGELKMPADFVKAACDEAHRLGMKVAAHVESTEGVEVALESGVDTIEHGAKTTPTVIDLFKDRKAALIATISPAMPMAVMDPEVSFTSEKDKYNGEIVFHGIVDCAKDCLENGVPVGLGTDTGCPFITHYNMWREVYNFHKYCGVSNGFALHTATEVNAKIAEIDHITGTIAEGKCADFVVTSKNPLEDLSALRDIDMVVTRGRVVEHPTVKKMADVESELDKIM